MLFMKLYILTTATFLTTVEAAPRGSWDEMARLEKGSRIKVTEHGEKTYNADFAGITETSVLLVKGKASIEVAKSAIYQVEIGVQPRRLRQAAIGAGIGLGLGFAIDQTIGTRFRNETGESAGTRAATYVLPAAAFAAIGAVMPAHRTLYQASKR
jgi:hypothetical protein